MIEVYINTQENEIRVVDRTTNKTNVYKDAYWDKDGGAYGIFTKTDNPLQVEKYLEFLPVARTRIIMKH